MKMLGNEANDPKFILELEDDDEFLFDDNTDWNYGLHAENPDSVCSSSVEAKIATQSRWNNLESFTWAL